MSWVSWSFTVSILKRMALRGSFRSSLPLAVSPSRLAFRIPFPEFVVICDRVAKGEQHHLAGRGITITITVITRKCKSSGLTYEERPLPL
ncbi:hypothetical protein FOVSG1_012667 [Fusarium oxysporum f. sp. vasinfectum]